jgi:hypothetical protein
MKYFRIYLGVFVREVLLFRKKDTEYRILGMATWFSIVVALIFITFITLILTNVYC